jgi:hypothetical protein
VNGKEPHPSIGSGRPQRVLFSCGSQSLNAGSRTHWLPASKDILVDIQWPGDRDRFESDFLRTVDYYFIDQPLQFLSNLDVYTDPFHKSRLENRLFDLCELRPLQR